MLIPLDSLSLPPHSQSSAEQTTILQYGLQTAFSEIERLSHQVTSSGNPITMDLKTRYVVKGLGKEQTISSVISILLNADGTKIEKLEDRWDDKLPDSGFQNVSFSDMRSWLSLASPWEWFKYCQGWAWRVWSLLWWTTPWLVSRRCSFR